MYKLIIRPLFFLRDAEKAHDVMERMIGWMSRSAIFTYILKLLYQVETVENAYFCGLPIQSMVSLPGGFDKNGNKIAFAHHMGYGMIEVGTVTPLPQVGNDKPRLFRLPKDESLINRMGFNNGGLSMLENNIKKFRKSYPKSKILIFPNIGKNKHTPNESAINDYASAYERLFYLSDGYVVNVSSPNTPGLRKLQDNEFQKKLFERFHEINQRNGWKPKPILIKISPNLRNESAIDFFNFIENEPLASGIVGTNTDNTREGVVFSDNKVVEDIGNGGWSGPSLYDRVIELIKLARDNGFTKEIVAVGGINSSKRALDAVLIGARLVQAYTGLVYEGPGLFKRIQKQLIKVDYLWEK